MHWKGLSKPQGFVTDEVTQFYGKFRAEPFERGFGNTIGNSLRRVLLSSLRGWAVSALKIEGVQHQFSSIPGVVEDATEVILNLKQLRVKLYSGKDGETDSSLMPDLSVYPPKIVYLSVKSERGCRDVLTSDIKPDPDIEILTPDIHVATLDESGELNIQIRIDYGRGYVPAEQHVFDDLPEGWIAVDSIYSPVQKVSFRVENVLHLERADYDRLLMEIWTDGSIEPLEASAHASKILKDIFQSFITFDEPEDEEEEEEEEKKPEVNPNLFKSIEELDLGSRPMNCLRTARMANVAQLVSKTDQELLKLENFGKESLREVKKVLAELDLDLGQDLSEIENIESYIHPDGDAKDESPKAAEEVPSEAGPEDTPSEPDVEVEAVGAKEEKKAKPKKSKTEKKKEPSTPPKKAKAKTPRKKPGAPEQDKEIEEEREE